MVSAITATLPIPDAQPKKKKKKNLDQKILFFSVASSLTWKIIPQRPSVMERKSPGLFQTVLGEKISK